MSNIFSQNFSGEFFREWKTDHNSIEISSEIISSVFWILSFCRFPQITFPNDNKLIPIILYWDTSLFRLISSDVNNNPKDIYELRVLTVVYFYPNRVSINKAWIYSIKWSRTVYIYSLASICSQTLFFRFFFSLIV